MKGVERQCVCVFLLSAHSGETASLHKALGGSLGLRLGGRDGGHWGAGAEARGEGRHGFLTYYAML